MKAKNKIHIASAVAAVSVLAAMSMVTASCGGGEKQSADTLQIDSVGYTGVDVNEVHRMPNLSCRDSMRVYGHPYSYSIDRIASDSLGVIRVDDYTRCAENSVLLTVSREGREYFRHRFTKRDFRMSDENRQHCVFEGMAYNTFNDDGVIFSATVGDGETGDVRFMYNVVVAPDGSFRTEQADLFDDEDITHFDSAEIVQ